MESSQPAVANCAPGLTNSGGVHAGGLAATTCPRNPALATPPTAECRFIAGRSSFQAVRQLQQLSAGGPEPPDIGVIAVKVQHEPAGQALGRFRILLREQVQSPRPRFGP